MADEIKVYGSNWCPHTRRALKDLEGWSVAFQYIDIDADPAAEQLIAGWNNGRAIRPTIDINGDVFVNPDTPTLKQELQDRGLL